MFRREQRKALAVCVFLIACGFFAAQLLFLDPKQGVYCYKYEDSAEEYCASDKAISAIAINASLIAHRYSEDIIAFVAVLLTLATWGMWRATRRLVSNAEYAAIGQRAYITASATIKPHLDDLETPSYEVVLINSGQTPAFNVYNWVRGAIAPHPLGSAKLPGPTGVTGVGSKGQLHGDRLAFLSEFLPKPSAEQLAAIRAGSNLFYVYGMSTYTDVFGFERHTPFRFVWGGPEMTRAGRAEMAFSEEGNEPD